MNAIVATIHVIDDEAAVRKALTRLLESAGYVVRSYESAGEFLRETPRDEPGCVLLDLALPGGLDGLQAQLAFQHGHDPLPVVFLTGRGSVAASVRAMKAGAIDFLEKPVEDALLLDAVRRALAFDADQRTRRSRDRLLSTRFASLTPREREVFRHVVAGRLNKQIAYDIGTCERTVKAHRARVMEKLHVRSVAELVHVADELEVAMRPVPAQSASRRELVVS
jgi:FixJ family two-component response regulator